MDDMAGAASCTEQDLTQFLTFAPNFHPQIHGNRVLQLERKLLNVIFSCLLQERAKDYLCQS